MSQENAKSFILYTFLSQNEEHLSYIRDYWMDSGVTAFLDGLVEQGIIAKGKSKKIGSILKKLGKDFQVFMNETGDLWRLYQESIENFKETEDKTTPSGIGLHETYGKSVVVYGELLRVIWINLETALKDREKAISKIISKANPNRAGLFESLKYKIFKDVISDIWQENLP
jgi:hypothetical protein